MGRLGYAEAFAKYGAKLKNVQWSVCAEAADGALAVSLWQHHLKRDGDSLVARDSFERWSGPGRDELRARLISACASGQTIRLVMAIAEDPARVDAGGSASTIGKHFSVREDLIGRVLECSDTGFVIGFRRAPA